MLPALRINPALKAADYAVAYKRDGIVQIPDIFEPASAEAVTQMLEQQMDWDIVYLDEHFRGQNLTRADIQAMGREGLRDILLGLQQRAGENLGLLYSGYAMITAIRTGRDPGHPIHDLTRFICNPGFLDFGAAVTRQPAVRRADAQATYYRPGDYIGLHDDTGWETGNRLTAYTLGFTRKWRSDWGGQLLFHDDRGDVSRGFVPRWNTLTLFKVPRLHSVAPVAPYARSPRISIVGWLRDDEPPPGGA